MKKLLLASLFYGLSMSGMGMGDPETLRVLSQMYTHRKSQARVSMDALDNQNANKNYQTINNDTTAEKKEDGVLNRQEDGVLNWRRVLPYLCCMPHNN